MFTYKSPIKVRSKIAVIGAGPSGLKASGVLASAGCEVDVYDANPEPGGLLIFGIPSFRFPKFKVMEGIDKLRELGVEFKVKSKVDGTELGRLIADYDALLICTGTWKARRLRIEGEGLKGVYYAFEYLFKRALFERGYLNRAELPALGDKVAVIGGGLTAIDASLSALRDGAEEVYLLYRRTRKYAPAGEREFKRAEREGVKVVELVVPRSIVGKCKVEGVEVVNVELGEPDESGRPKPFEVSGTEHVIEVDSVLIAIGELPTPPPSIEKIGIKVESDGRIAVDSKHMTTRRGVFAAGDVVLGPSKIGLALKDGLEAALSTLRYLSEGRV